jgi:tRNA pseudouridine55 synthase
MTGSTAGKPAPRIKRVWQRVDAVLLLDKPLGMSSNHALQAARRLFNAEKGGHTGTLDPLATGLLPLCFGEATKFAGELLNADKRYLARIHLGITTDTEDAEGAVLSESPVKVNLAEIEAVLTEFRGEISQLPPMYSALKRDGKPLYAYARAGIELVREPRQVRIHELRLLNCDLPFVEIDVLCSKGTYIRTLAADIGARLGCGAHLASLRRTGIGPLDLSQAVPLAALEAASDEMRKAHLMSVDALLSTVPSIRLDAEQTRRIGHGQAIPWAGDVGSRYRLISDTDVFLGVGNLASDHMLQPERLIANNQTT